MSTETSTQTDHHAAILAARDAARAEGEPMADYWPGEPLPPIPEIVHGVVMIDPTTAVQCDGCHRVRVTTAKNGNLSILTSGVLFNARAAASDQDHRRLCRECRPSTWTD